MRRATLQPVDPSVPPTIPGERQVAAGFQTGAPPSVPPAIAGEHQRNLRTDVLQQFDQLGGIVESIGAGDHYALDAAVDPLEQLLSLGGAGSVAGLQPWIFDERDRRLFHREALHALTQPSQATARATVAGLVAARSDPKYAQWM